MNLCFTFFLFKRSRNLASEKEIMVYTLQIQIHLTGLGRKDIPVYLAFSYRVTNSQPDTNLKVVQVYTCTLFTLSR
jgi:hypothetical protein